MRSLLTLTLTLLLSAAIGQSYTDQFFKDFASPAGDEVAMQSCSFDPDASAVYLRKDAAVIPDGQRMFKYCRNRIKILNASGLEEGNIRIRYYHLGEYEKISNITAVTINYDQNGDKRMSPIKPKDIHYTKDDQYYTTITFSMPEVKPGSIIEYSYTSERLSYQIVDYWYFQDELPVLHSSFDYTIMPGAEFSYRVLKSQAYPVSMKEDKMQGRLLFQMNELPGITDEPYMDARRDYLSRVELQMNFVGSGIERQRFVGSWPELTQELLKDEEFGQAISRKIPGTEELVRLAMLKPDMKERMELIFRNVQRQLTWDHYIGIYAKEKLKTVWEKKRGSAAEINLTLLNLLGQAGVSAYPLLVSDRYHGKVNTSHPFINQFSKVIAYVEIGGKSYYLDAAEDHSQADLIPMNFLNTRAYLVDRKRSRFITISDPDHFDKRHINIAGKLTPQGVLEAQAFISSRDYARLSNVKEIRVDKEGFVSKHFVKPYNELAVQNFEVRNLEADSLPLEQLFNFTHKLEQSGDYLMMYPNVFAGMDKNPFLAVNRYTEINFGSKRNISWSESYAVEDGLMVEALPKSITMRTPDTGLLVSRVTDISPDGRRFVVKLKIEINREVYGADEYAAVREFFKKMFDILNEPIVLRKKPK